MEASTITELLVTMTVTGILMLAVYDGLGLIAGTINLHLKKDGAYKLQQFEKDDALPEALLTLHNALKKKRRKKNV